MARSCALSGLAWHGCPLRGPDVAYGTRADLVKACQLNPRRRQPVWVPTAAKTVSGSINFAFTGADGKDTELKEARMYAAVVAADAEAERLVEACEKAYGNVGRAARKATKMMRGAAVGQRSARCAQKACAWSDFQGQLMQASIRAAVADECHASDLCEVACALYPAPSPSASATSKSCGDWIDALALKEGNPKERAF